MVVCVQPYTAQHPYPSPYSAAPYAVTAAAPVPPLSGLLSPDLFAQQQQAQAQWFGSGDLPQPDEYPLRHGLDLPHPTGQLPRHSAPPHFYRQQDDGSAAYGYSSAPGMSSVPAASFKHSPGGGQQQQ